jgi:hypothetical protein
LEYLRCFNNWPHSTKKAICVSLHQDRECSIKLINHTALFTQSFGKESSTKKSCVEIKLPVGMPPAHKPQFRLVKCSPRLRKSIRLRRNQTHEEPSNPPVPKGLLRSRRFRHQSFDRTRWRGKNRLSVPKSRHVCRVLYHVRSISAHVQ